MRKDYHTNNAIRETVKQLDRIDIDNDPQFTKFLKRSEDEQIEILWTLVNLTIKAGLHAMGKGLSFTLPNICRFHTVRYSEYIRETRRVMLDKGSVAMKAAVKDKLSKTDQFTKHGTYLFK